jgi:hypothetical protein
MYIGSCRGKSRGRRVRASKAEHLMTRAEELLDDGGTDEAGGAGNEDTHISIIDWHVATID